MTEGTQTALSHVLLPIERENTKMSLSESKELFFAPMRHAAVGDAEAAFFMAGSKNHTSAAARSRAI